MSIPIIAIRAGLGLLPRVMTSDEALVMMIAIGLQESRFVHRKQIGGPALGFWQFEKHGGVKGVMQHASSKKHAERVCAKLSIPFDRTVIYNSLAYNDPLAAAFARLLLWTDPKPLPELGDVNGAWDYYIRNWRPGKPHRRTWNALYAQALDYIDSGAE